MRKKFFFMSVMLMGLVSLFSSCVDGDYYDFYDDEEILSPRSKKGKDMPGDLSNYPKLNDGWHEAECVACCYSNIFGADNVTSRLRVIQVAYGSLEENYERYFRDVDAYGVPESAVSSLFGSGTFSVEDLARYCINNGGGSVSNRNWVAFADASSGGGTHVAKVMELSIGSWSRPGYKDITIRVVDQTNNGAVHNKYHIIVDNHNRYYDKSASLRHFIGSL